MDKKMIKVIFVCMGNICRSPTAEGIFRHLVQAKGLESRILIDSAGTHGYHAGDPPDPRAAAAAAKRGYDLSGIRGRSVLPADFMEFDYILAMDSENLVFLRALKPDGAPTDAKLFLEFSRRFTEREVPDPYYGGPQGFDRVLDLIEDAAAGFLEHLLKTDLAAEKLGAAR